MVKYDINDIQQDETELQPGARVVHPVFGRGEIQRVTGTGMRTRVVVRFHDGIERTLLADYDQLQVMPGGGIG